MAAHVTRPLGCPPGFYLWQEMKGIFARWARWLVSWCNLVRSWYVCEWLQMCLCQYAICICLSAKETQHIPLMSMNFRGLVGGYRITIHLKLPWDQMWISFLSEFIPSLDHITQGYIIHVVCNEEISSERAVRNDAFKKKSLNCK